MKSLVKKRWRKEKGPVPLYQQIADFIAGAINSGELPLHYVLPGHRPLAAMFGVGVQTILHALRILQQGRMVTLAERSRTVVAKRPRHAPDWDAFIGDSAFQPAGRNFFSISESHKESINLSMGLDTNYYLRDMFNQVMPHVSLPVSLGGHPFGLPVVREALCAYMARFGIACGLSQVMTVISITHALNVLFLALLGPRSSLLVAKPCQVRISKLLQATGCTVVEIPMDAHGINPYSLTRAIEKHPQPVLCLSPDCNVPTGTITSGKRREEILAICSRAGVPIIEYTTFPLGSTQSELPSLKSLDTSQTVVHVSQIGVNASTNPWVGWIIADEYLLQRINTLRFNYDAHQNYLMQMALLEVIRRELHSTYLTRLAAVRVERQAVVNKLLRQYLAPYAAWNHENIDACVWMRLNNNISVRRLYDDAVDITFQPGWFYGDAFADHIYLSPLVLSAENLELGLQTTVQLIKRQFA